MIVDLTLEQVAEWALRHGFTRRDESTLATTWRDVEIRITIMRRYFKVTAHRGDMWQRLGGGHPKDMFINNDDLLEGAGLGYSLFQLINSPDQIPPWYPEAVRARVIHYLTETES